MEGKGKNIKKAMVVGPINRKILKSFIDIRWLHI